MESWMLLNVLLTAEWRSKTHWKLDGFVSSSSSIELLKDKQLWCLFCWTLLIFVTLACCLWLDERCWPPRADVLARTAASSNELVAILIRRAGCIWWVPSQVGRVSTASTAEVFEMWNQIIHVLQPEVQTTLTATCTLWRTLLLIVPFNLQFLPKSKGSAPLLKWTVGSAV